jgi:hypothetical protein
VLKAENHPDWLGTQQRNIKAWSPRNVKECCYRNIVGQVGKAITCKNVEWTWENKVVIAKSQGTTKCGGS